MLIAADIGNSSINVGFFYGKDMYVLKLPTHPLLAEGEYSEKLGSFIAENAIDNQDISCIISSVVVTHTAALAGALRMLARGREAGVLIVGPGLKLGINMEVTRPAEMGADRVAAAAAAYDIFHGPVAVVDFGTATTVTVVDAEGSCRGGAILAGLGLMNEALGRGTSRLEAVSLDPPERALGRDTAENMRAGIFFGSAGAVERIVSEIERELGYGLELVVTGGNGEAISPLLGRKHMFRPHLVLEGLRLLYEYNRNP